MSRFRIYAAAYLLPHRVHQFQDDKDLEMGLIRAVVDENENLQRRECYLPQQIQSRFIRSNQFPSNEGSFQRLVNGSLYRCMRDEVTLLSMEHDAHHSFPTTEYFLYTTDSECTRSGGCSATNTSFLPSIAGTGGAVTPQVSCGSSSIHTPGTSTCKSDIPAGGLHPCSARSLTLQHGAREN